MILKVKPIEPPFLKNIYNVSSYNRKQHLHHFQKPAMFVLPDDTVNQFGVLTCLDSYLGLFDCKASTAANDFVCKCQYVSTAVS